MRYKPVPPAPESLDAVARARDSLPASLDPDVDCCARVMDAVDVDRAGAADWLVFLTALGLLRESGGKYAQTNARVDRDALAAALLENVYGARELADALGEEDEVTAGTVVSRVSARRNRERVERLFDWFCLFGVVARNDDGY